MNKHYHYGQTIKEYRQKRGMSQATLAEYWPGHPVNIRYVQFVETGKETLLTKIHSANSVNSSISPSGSSDFLSTIPSVRKAYPDTVNASSEKHSIPLNTSSKRHGTCGA